jgi:hypothetical protein
MQDRKEWSRLFFSLFLWLAVAGCGTEDAAPDTDPSLPRNGPPSCETLGPRLFQDPLTGSAFHCLWCNREWKWTIPSENRNLFVLVSLTCERLRSEAYLEMRDTQGSILWEREIRTGDNESFCIRPESSVDGALTVRLRGSRNLLLFSNLIEEFRGSVYLKVFDERGRLVTGPGY